jgi:pyridoxamine 5'-phosphate oxidase family protein
MFTEAEIAYLTDQPLCRFATVGQDGTPHITPVGVHHDAGTIVIGSVADMTASKKFRDARRHPAVALVVDDLASYDPWTPRGIEIRGRAETLDEGGEAVGERVGASFPFTAAWIRVHPSRIVSWGINDAEFSARTVA